MVNIRLHNHFRTKKYYFYITYELLRFFVLFK